MLYSFLTSLVDTFSFLNVFKYITFRIGLSVVTSLIIVFLIGNPLIKYFSKKQITGPIRKDGPIDHIIKKTGTPTMGGLMILIGIIVSTLMWADLKNIYIWTVLFVCTSHGIENLRIFIRTQGVTYHCFDACFRHFLPVFWLFRHAGRGSFVACFFKKVLVMVL